MDSTTSETTVGRSEPRRCWSNLTVMSRRIRLRVDAQAAAAAEGQRHRDRAERLQPEAGDHLEPAVRRVVDDDQARFIARTLISVGAQHRQRTRDRPARACGVDVPLQSGSSRRGLNAAEEWVSAAGSRDWVEGERRQRSAELAPVSRLPSRSTHPGSQAYVTVCVALSQTTCMCGPTVGACAAHQSAAWQAIEIASSAPTVTRPCRRCRRHACRPCRPATRATTTPAGPCGPVGPASPFGPCGPVSPLRPRRPTVALRALGPASPRGPAGPAGP